MGLKSHSSFSSSGQHGQQQRSGNGYTFSLDPLIVKIQSGFFRDGKRYPTGVLVLHIRHRGNEKLLCAVILWISTFLERNTPNRDILYLHNLHGGVWVFFVSPFPS